MENIQVPEKEPYEGKATQKQKQLIWELGFNDNEVIDELGKKQASHLIDQLIFTQEKKADMSFHQKKLKIFGGVFVICAIAPLAIEHDAIPGLSLILGCIAAYGTIKHGFKSLKVKLRRNKSL